MSLLLGLGLTIAIAWGQRVGTPTGDLTTLSIEDLFSLEITSVDRKAQSLAKAPAAVFVITNEDLRRSGATSLPEALRMVPGLDAARINGDNWAISSRGFNRQFNNKMLVLIDGRSVYNRIYAGVMWEQHNFILEDIERIEVIRGPGAVMWGANAVNGVINVITKSAKSTQGMLVSLASGNEDRAIASVRYGGKAGEALSYRVFARYGHSQLSTGQTPVYRLNYRPAGGSPVLGDGTVGSQSEDSGQAGFRMDWLSRRGDDLTVLGAVAYSVTDQAFTPQLPQPPFRARLIGTSEPLTGNLVARWTRHHKPGRESTFQWYTDWASEPTPITALSATATDFQYQYRRSLTDNQELYLGAGYRYTSDRITGNPTLIFAPSERRESLYSAVIRHEYTAFRNRLVLSTGARVEHNVYTGFEWQPSVRALWAPNARESVWAAWSKAVRTPSWTDRGLETQIAATSTQGVDRVDTLFWANGNPNYAAEKLISHEAGYRRQVGQHWSVDAAAYYNRYSSLPLYRLSDTLRVLGPTTLRQDLFLSNAGRGETAGIELWGTWAVNSRWKILPAYTHLRTNLAAAVPGYLASTFQETAVPAHSFVLRSIGDLSRRWQLDTSVYRTGPRLNSAVAGQFRWNARLGWKPSRGHEFSAIVQDILDRRQIEILPESAYTAMPMRRAFLLRWVARF